MNDEFFEEEVKEEKPKKKRQSNDPVLCFNTDNPNVKFYRKESVIKNSNGKLEKS